MVYLHAKFNDWGKCAYWDVMEMLTEAEGHAIQVDEVFWIMMVREWRCPEEQAQAFFDEAVKIGAFQIKNGMLECDALTQSLEPMYAERRRKDEWKRRQAGQSDPRGVPDPSPSDPSDVTGTSPGRHRDVAGQVRVEKSRVEKSRVDPPLSPPAGGQDVFPVPPAKPEALQKPQDPTPVSARSEEPNPPPAQHKSPGQVQATPESDACLDAWITEWQTALGPMTGVGVPRKGQRPAWSHAIARLLDYAPAVEIRSIAAFLAEQHKLHRAGVAGTFNTQSPVAVLHGDKLQKIRDAIERQRNERSGPPSRAAPFVVPMDDEMAKKLDDLATRDPFAHFPVEFFNGGTHARS